VDDFRGEQVVIHGGRVRFVDYEFLKMKAPEHSLYWLTGGFMGKWPLSTRAVETYCGALAEEGLCPMDPRLAQERLDCVRILDAMSYFAVAAEASFGPSSWPGFDEWVEDIPSWYQGLLERLADVELYASAGIGARMKEWLLDVG